VVALPTGRELDEHRPEPLVESAHLLVEGRDQVESAEVRDPAAHLDREPEVWRRLLRPRPELSLGGQAVERGVQLDRRQPLAVVNGARVSFNQASDDMSDRDAGLIGFLMRDGHGSPFEHGYFRFIVKAPLFVVREHHRHRAGHSYNEWSGRYSKMEAEFYVPENVRTQVGKPGAYSFEPVDDETREATRREIEDNARRAFQAYERLLERDVAKEVARA